MRPTTTLGSIGGLWSEVGFGGQTIGRGIRLRRYIGGVKVIGQSELRIIAAGKPGRFNFVIQSFVDAGWIGAAIRNFDGDRRRVLLGFGGGIGAYWSKSFVLRFDVALSELERYDPFYYLSLSHPF